MALGPDTLREKAEERAKVAEQRIDAAIRDSDAGRVTIGADLLGISRADWDAILAPRYRAAGWTTAEWMSDQRDGDYIDLVP